MQHSNKHTCNIRLEKQLKHWEQKLATYVYNHCNISIYFCNIHMKHLHHLDETSDTLETYSCNMRFQRAMSPSCLDESRSSTPTRRMELVGAPLGEDLLGGLGEHMRKAHEHPGRASTRAPWESTCTAPWASAPLASTCSATKRAV